MFFGRDDAKAETPIHWPTHAKSWLIGKDSDAWRDWGQEEKGMTEDEMAGWHHQLDGREFGWITGVGDGQGGLACCNSWGRKESDTNEGLNWTEVSSSSPVWVAYPPLSPSRIQGLSNRGVVFYLSVFKLACDSLQGRDDYLSFWVVECLFQCRTHHISLIRSTCISFQICQWQNMDFHTWVLPIFKYGLKQKPSGITHDWVAELVTCLSPTPSDLRWPLISLSLSYSSIPHAVSWPLISCSLNPLLWLVTWALFPWLACWHILKSHLIVIPLGICTQA